MKTHYTPGKTEYRTMTTAQFRAGFLLDDLFAKGEIRLTYVDLDRAIVGAAIPANGPLELKAAEELRAEFFCQRRELGVLNIGGVGTVTVDGVAYELATTDILYVGRGSKAISFAGNEAVYYLISYPAHKEYPTKKATAAEANTLNLGSQADANERVLRQYIHEKGVQSCQLVMGWTELKKGSVWNTMPSHTHTRRSEVYMYFDVPANHAVVHFMGEPQETRPLWMHDRQVALSPAWSVHSGCGTNSYKFCWAMGGENQRFDDMDPAPIPTLR